MRYNEKGLFPALEAVLKKSKHPMDAHMLYEKPEIREHAASVNRVSDYLGNMWRKGQVIRSPAAREDGDHASRTRWMYEWKGGRGPKLHDAAGEYAPRIIVDRPAMLVSEDGNTITVEFPNLIIVLKQK